MQQSDRKLLVFRSYRRLSSCTIENLLFSTVPDLEVSKAPVHTKNVKGRKIPTDPLRREGILPNLEGSEGPVRIKSAKGRNTPEGPYKNGRGYRSNPRAFEGTRSHEECERKEKLDTLRHRRGVGGGKNPFRTD